MQYTIRNVPEHLDATLRNAAREQGKSLNEVAVQALVRGAGLGHLPRRKRDLSDLASSWREDPAFDSALAAQDIIDEELWPPHSPTQKEVRKGLRKGPPAPVPARQKRLRPGTAA